MKYLYSIKSNRLQSGFTIHMTTKHIVTSNNFKYLLVFVLNYSTETF